MSSGLFNWGTNYSAALEMADSELKGMDPNNKNVVIFFTDGMPTREIIDITIFGWHIAGTGWVGYSIQQNGTYEWETLGSLSGWNTSDPLNAGDAVWLNGNDSVKERARVLREDRKAEVYCINCTSDDSKTWYGLKKYVATKEDPTAEVVQGDNKYYMAGESSEKIKESFNKIAENLTYTETDPITLTSTGEMTLKRVSKIREIKVGTTPYSFDNIEGTNTYVLDGRFSITPNEDDEATIDLDDYSEIFHQPGNITVIY